MSTQTFAHPPYAALMRAVLALPRAIASAVVDSVSWLSPQKARAELLQLADSRAKSDPQFAARLRKAAKANWYGDA
jgi:hypothetical protein